MSALGAITSGVPSTPAKVADHRMPLAVAVQTTVPPRRTCPSLARHRRPAADTADAGYQVQISASSSVTLGMLTMASARSAIHAGSIRSSARATPSITEPSSGRARFRAFRLTGAWCHWGAMPKRRRTARRRSARMESVGEISMGHTSVQFA